MISISWDTVQSVALGLLGAAWTAAFAITRNLHARIRELEQQRTSRAEFDKLAHDVEIVKRVLYLVAHKLEVPAEALDR